MESVIRQTIELLEEIQNNIEEKNLQEVKSKINQIDQRYQILYDEEDIEFRILLDIIIEICQKDPSLNDALEYYIEKRDDLNQDRERTYSAYCDESMWEELEDYEDHDYYGKKSVLDLTRNAAEYWLNHHDDVAKEYYLRAKRLVSLLNQEDMLVFFEPYNFLEYIYIQKKDYDSAKEYYLWKIEQLSAIKHTACGIYIIESYMKLAALALHAGNLEEMNDYYLKIEQLILSKIQNTSNFIGMVEVDRIIHEVYFKDIIHYNLLNIGENKEEYYHQLLQWSRIYQPDFEGKQLFKEAMNYLKREKNRDLLQEIIKVYEPKKEDDHSTDRYYLDQVIDAAKEVYGSNSLELAKLFEHIADHAFNNDIYYNEIDYYGGFYQGALSIYEHYFPIGSQELYDKYKEVIMIYLRANQLELFVRIVKVYRDRLINKHQRGSNEFLNEMNELCIQYFHKELYEYWK